MVDKVYAMSSFLQFRTVYDSTIKFSEELDYPYKKQYCNNRREINNSEELYHHIKDYIEREAADGKAALALSSGIDSAILAKFMPKGSVAYTFKCVVPGIEVVDETPKARQFCNINGLEHRIVEIYWEDYEKYVPILMKHKNAPIHSIEVQIYKAALQAKADGFDKFILGENADIVFGGMNSLLSQKYTIGDFVDRFSYVLPYKALKEFELILEPFIKYQKNGFMDIHAFINDIFYNEANNTYTNACETANVRYVSPYPPTVHEHLDIERIRNGDSKYLVREVFRKLYPNTEMTPKTPMPRPVNEWFSDWGGPKRPEFWENCHINMTGDQKYYVWILEKFLDMMEENDICISGGKHICTK